MTIQKRGSTIPAPISIGSTIAVPGTPAAGDLMFAVFSSPAGAPREFSVMDGWHHYNQAMMYDDAYFLIYYRVSAGSEPATYTTNFSIAMTGAMFVLYSDASAHVAIDTIAIDIRSSSTSIIFPTVTFSAAGMLLNFGTLDSSSSLTPPGGSTEEWDGPSFTSGRLYLMTEARGSSGSTGTRTATAGLAESSELLSLAAIDTAFVYPLSPVYRDRTVAGQSTGTSKTVAAPPNLKVGDLMVLQVGFDTSSPAFTVSGGAVTWAAVPNGAITGNNSIHSLTGVAAAGDIGATYTISWTGSKTLDAAITCYYSPSGYVLTVDVAVNQTNAAAVNIPFPTITPVNSNSLVLWLASNDSSSSSTWDTAATRGIAHITDGTNVRIHCFTEYVPTASATGTRTATIGGATNNSKVVAIAISEALTPDAPTSLIATASSSSAIGLTWTDASSNETGFEIEQSATGVGSWSLIHTTAANATSYNVTGLSESTPYFFRVRAIGAGTPSSYSNTATATTDLLAPTSLTATAASPSQIDLSWTDASSAEDGYSIEQSPNGSSWSVIHTTAANAVSYSVTGLTQNTQYFFRVRAYHGAQNSTYAATANAYTDPATQTGLSASAVLSTKINLSWTNSGSGQDGFKVERSPNGSSSWAQIGTSATTTYADTTVSASTIYYYRVRAYRSTQNGAYSSNASATTPAALTTPTALLATVVSPSSARLSWTDSNLALTGFSLERNTNGGAFSVVATPVASPYIDTTATPGATHQYKVRAYRTGSTEFSSYSSTVSLIMPIAPAGVKPSHLFLLNPAVVYSGQVNMATPVYPVDSITVDTTTGTYGNIKPGMTITFGSAAGLSDQGRQRVRTTPGGAIIGIGRSPRGRHTGEINIADNSYFTIYDEYRVWSKVPAFTAAGVIFKDVDIPVGSFTTTPPPVSNCGPGFCGTISAGVITVQFTSTSFTTAPAATISTYAWNIADGSLTAGSLSGSTVTCTFPSGFRWIHLTITDSNGKVHISHCPVYARDPAADTSVRNFQITQHSIKPTGQNISFNIRQDISAPPDGMLAMLWEGEAATPADRSHMSFIGYEHTDPATIAAGRTGTLKDVTLDCVDVAGMLQVLAGYSSKIEHGTSPTDWLHFAYPNVDLYIHHLLQFNTTALDLADFQLSGTGNTYNFELLQSDAMNTHAQVQQLCQKMIPEWSFTCNRRGQLAIKIDPFTQQTADRTATVQTTLYAFDYSDIKYTRQYFPTVSKIRKWAILTGLGTPTSISSLAPGLSPGQGVEVRELTEGLVPSQSVLNDATGQLYARLNSTLGKLAITLAYGDDRGIEPANMTWVDVDLPAAIAAQRGLTLTVARGLVSDMAIRYDYRREGTVKTIDLTWEAETVGYVGTTEVHEVTAPLTTGVIPAPVVPEVVPPPSIASGVQKVAMIDNHGGIVTTSNFQSSPPTWVAYTGIVSDTSVDNFSSHPFHSMIVDPFSPLYRGLGTTVNVYAVNQTRIWKIADIFGVLGSPVITSIHTFDVGDHPFVLNRTIMASFGRYFTAEADNPWLMVSSYYRNLFADTPNGTFVVYSKDAGATWSLEKFITGDHDSEPTIYKVYYNGLYLSPRVPGKAYAVAYHLDGNDPYSTSARGYVSTDWGETWTYDGSLIQLTGGNMGGMLHVPYSTNTAERIVYYGAAGDVDFRLIETDGVAIDRTPPAISGNYYGPLRYPFGVRTFDSDRKYVAMAGRGNGVDAQYLSSTHNKAAVFVSSDYGATWTNIVAPISANVNDVFPDSVAFAGNDRNTLYIWGNEFYVAQSTDFGATVEDKYGNIGGLAYAGYEEVLLFAGGDS